MCAFQSASEPLGSEEVDHLPSAAQVEAGAPLFPQETDIYILPDGQIIVSDMPAELAAAFAALRYTDAPPDPPFDNHQTQP